MERPGGRCGIAAALLLLLSPGLQAGELDLNLNDDAARISYAWPVRSDELQVDVGLLHHQDRGEVLHLGLHLTDFASSGPNPVRGGLGGKLFYTDTDTVFDDEFSLALGGFLRYTLPRYNRFTVSGHAYLAPDVLSWGDAEQFFEAEARLSYNVLREGDVYLGARYVSLDFNPGGNYRIDNGLHVGIQLRFK